MNTQALSATTLQQIHGSSPYLTFDNGLTKITTTDDLLGITLSDGTRITPSTNISTEANPIQLTEGNQSFADIGMMIPTDTNSINLSALIGDPYNYWGDDDGDGQDINGVTATGRLSVSITDKNGLEVSRDTILSVCDKTPYKVVLTSTNGSITTKYGVPNSSSFSDSSVTYYINPKAGPKICYIVPYGPDISGPWVGPANIWSPGKGYLVQSTAPSSYGTNFPTIGTHNVYFDLDISGINGSTLTWPTISQGGITATMTPSPSNPNNIRVTLTGPVATTAQHDSSSPGSVTSPSLPQQFEIVGYDSRNTAILKYGFVLKQWFVNRGSKKDTVANHSSWCTNLGGGYRLTRVKDLTNAKCGVDTSWFPCVNGIDGATPSSAYNSYQLNIGAGLFTEWGGMETYPEAGYAHNSYYWTSDRHNSDQFRVNSDNGYVNSWSPSYDYYGVCAYP